MSSWKYWCKIQKPGHIDKYTHMHISICKYLLVCKCRVNRLIGFNICFAFNKLKQETAWNLPIFSNKISLFIYLYNLLTFPAPLVVRLSGLAARAVICLHKLYDSQLLCYFGNAASSLAPFHSSPSLCSSHFLPLLSIILCVSVCFCFFSIWSTRRLLLLCLRLPFASVALSSPPFLQHAESAAIEKKRGD